jgi:peptide/nickel transport system permease protein
MVGLPIGIMLGYRGGRLDLVAMRGVDAMFALPPLVMSMALAAVIGGGYVSVVIAIALMSIPTYIRLVRGQTLQARELGYVEAANAAGAGDVYIMRRHIFPNITSQLIVQASVTAAAAILIEAGLGFLGVGIQLPTATWGGMVRSAANFLETAPWLVLFSGATIFLTVLAFNLLGDSLRDTLDPKLN